MSRYFFLHASSGKSWEVDDPARWCIENAHDPTLERARERLVALDTADSQRVVRVVVRRCRLNLIEIQPERVIIHHWGQQGQGDLRSFFRKHSLARQGVEVFLIDRKREVVAVQPGDDFLYGERLPQDFPLDLYRRKWQRQGREGPDDGTAAPGSWSSFVWEGIEPGLVPWAALKGAWKTENPPPCPNCDTPLVLFGFGREQCGMFNWRARFIRLCPQCRRQAEDTPPPNLEPWLLAHLDRRTLPGFQRVWGQVVKWQPPGDPGKGLIEYERPSRRDFLLAAFVAGASLALAGGLKPSPACEVNPPSGKTLGELLTELGQVFGRFTKWQVYCKEQNAITEADLIGLAEQVLAEPCTGTVAEGHSYWLRLNGVQSIPCPYPYTPTGF